LFAIEANHREDIKMNESNSAWQYFESLQRTADPHSVDRSLARDEALDAVLDEVLANPSPDKDLISNRFYSLCRNRLSKQLHRRSIDNRRIRSTQRRGGADYGSELPGSPVDSPFHQISYRQLTDLIRTVLPDQDFELLLEIADGVGYSDIARSQSKTVSSLKTKVFRVREKLRNSQISPILLGWRRQ
jgi:hypothetical protein